MSQISTPKTVTGVLVKLGNRGQGPVYLVRDQDNKTTTLIVDHLGPEDRATLDSLHGHLVEVLGRVSNPGMPMQLYAINDLGPPPLVRRPPAQKPLHP